MRKKIFTLCALCILAVTAAAADVIYFFGNGWDWTDTEEDLYELTETTAGVYIGEVTLVASKYYAIYTQIDEDWTLTYRYGPYSGGSSITLNSETQIYNNESLGWETSFYASSDVAGTCTMTVDMRDEDNMTVIFENEDYEVTIPTTLYLMGNDGVWDVSTATETLTDDDEDGVFEGTMTMADESGEGYGWFCLFSELGSWDAAYRYGPETNGDTLSSGTQATVYSNVSTSWTAYTGDYNLVIDLNEMTITATLVEDEDSEETDDDSSSTGISSVTANADANGVYNVYSLSGVRVLSTTNTEDINSLTAGVYIVDGKKVIIK